MGGIVERITKEYLSLDSALQGPSMELTRHGVGYVVYLGATQVPYCNNGLTEYEVMTILGSYTLIMSKYINSL